MLLEPRQRDAVHAPCSGYANRRFRAGGWETGREVEIVHGRSHGWIDLLAFDPRTGLLLIVEIKTRLDDLGLVERQLAWYERSAFERGTQGRLAGQTRWGVVARPCERRGRCCCLVKSPDAFARLSGPGGRDVCGHHGWRLADGLRPRACAHRSGESTTQLANSLSRGRPTVSASLPGLRGGGSPADRLTGPLSRDHLRTAGRSEYWRRDDGQRSWAVTVARSSRFFVLAAAATRLRKSWRDIPDHPRTGPTPDAVPGGTDS